MVAAVAEDCIVTVLLSGESGTGKELIARAIHANGCCRNNPFVPVMLNALPQSMLEAELFGVSARGIYRCATSSCRLSRKV